MALSQTPDFAVAGNDVFQSTSVNVPIPSGVVAGQLLVWVGNFSNNQANSSAVSISGWTSFGTTDSGAWGKWAFWKIADSTDQSNAGSGSWSLTCSDGFIEQWVVAGWSGVDSSTPFAAGPSINYASTTTFTFNSITSPGSGSIWVGLFTVLNNSGGITADPSGLTKEVSSTSPFYTAPAVAYTATVGSGATTAYSGTISSGFEWVTISMILKPSGGGGSTPVSSSDTGSGSEGTPKISQSRSDTSSGAEGTPKIAQSQTDAGTGTEGTAKIGQSQTDTGAGADSQSVAVAITQTDTATGTDGQSVNTGNTPVNGTETGSGTDGQSIVVTLSSSDTGSGAEGTVRIALAGADTSSGADAQSLAVAVSQADTAAGVEGWSILVTLSSSDVGGAADAGSASVPGADNRSIAPGTEIMFSSEAVTNRGIGSQDTAAGIEGVPSILFKVLGLADTDRVVFSEMHFVRKGAKRLTWLAAKTAGRRPGG